MTTTSIALAGLAAGFIVGLTGMGGGALLTPLLILGFGVEPLQAVSSDLVVSLVMKPFGAAIHARRGNVNARLVRWLSIGSIPSAFVGVLVLRAIGAEQRLSVLRLLIGGVLLLASASAWVRHASRRRMQGSDDSDLVVRPLATVVIGALGGFAVGLTSVGAGSLMMVMLAVVYPRMSAARLVGTDLAQAIPLVASAAIGHLVFGDPRFGLTVGLLVGGIPGVCLGARFSSRSNDSVVRPAIALALAISGARLVF